MMKINFREINCNDSIKVILNDFDGHIFFFFLEKKEFY